MICIGLPMPSQRSDDLDDLNGLGSLWLNLFVASDHQQEK